jgi:hypothetical protein
VTPLKSSIATEMLVRHGLPEHLPVVVRLDRAALERVVRALRLDTAVVVGVPNGPHGDRGWAKYTATPVSTVNCRC